MSDTLVMNNVGFKAMDNDELMMVDGGHPLLVAAAAIVAVAAVFKAGYEVGKAIGNAIGYLTK